MTESVTPVGAEPPPVAAAVPVTAAVAPPGPAARAPSQRFAWQPLAIGLVGVLVIVVAIVSAL